MPIRKYENARRRVEPADDRAGTRRGSRGSRGPGTRRRPRRIQARGRRGSPSRFGVAAVDHEEDDRRPRRAASHVFVDFVRVTRRNDSDRRDVRLQSAGREVLPAFGASPPVRVPPRRPPLPADARPQGPGLRDLPVLRAVGGRAAAATPEFRFLEQSLVFFAAGLRRHASLRSAASRWPRTLSTARGAPVARSVYDRAFRKIFPALYLVDGRGRSSSRGTGSRARTRPGRSSARSSSR